MSKTSYIIRNDDLTDPRVAGLIIHHIKTILDQTSAGSANPIGIDHLKKDGVTFWTAWVNDELAAMGALKEVEPHHGELKSFHTVERFRRRGIGSTLLQEIITEARQRGMKRLSLETSRLAYFQPAIALYRAHQFVDYVPFGDYPFDPENIWLSRLI